MGIDMRRIFLGILLLAAACLPSEAGMNAYVAGSVEVAAAGQWYYPGTETFGSNAAAASAYCNGSLIDVSGVSGTKNVTKAAVKIGTVTSATSCWLAGYVGDTKQQSKTFAPSASDWNEVVFDSSFQVTSASEVELHVECNGDWQLPYGSAGSGYYMANTFADGSPASVAAANLEANHAYGLRLWAE